MLWLLIGSGNPLLATVSVFLEHELAGVGGVDKQVPVEFQPLTWPGLVEGVAFSLLLPAGDLRVSSAGRRDACPALALHILSPRENTEQAKAVRVRRARGGRRGGYLVSADVFLCVKNISGMKQVMGWAF